MSSDPIFYRIADLVRRKGQPGRTPFARPTLYKKIRDGSFPKPEYIGGIPCWRKSVIDRWLEECAARPAPSPALQRSRNGLYRKRAEKPSKGKKK